MATKKNTVLKEIPLSLLAAVLVGVLANDILIDGSKFSVLSRIDGIVFLAFFIIFLYYTVGIAKITEETASMDIAKLSNFKAALFIFGGLAGLVLGGKWIVDGAVKIAEGFNVSQSLIGLTIVAVGTSLPELATSAVAAYKKQTDIAIGNVVGSNIFNIFWILGVSAVIRPLPFNPNSNSDILMTVFASILLLLEMYIGKKFILERWQGGMMVLTYIGYVVFLIVKQ